MIVPSSKHFVFEDGEWWYVQIIPKERHKNHRRRARPKVQTCQECKQDYLSSPFSAATRKFCSRACFGKKHSRASSGRRGGRWKGGKKVERGYVHVWIPPEERTGARIYKLEHRLVMEQVLGRALEAHERVHHKNGIRDDNRPENLELWTLGHSMPGVRAEDAKHCPTCTCGQHPAP